MNLAEALLHTQQVNMTDKHACKPASLFCGIVFLCNKGLLFLLVWFVKFLPHTNPSYGGIVVKNAYNYSQITNLQDAILRHLIFFFVLFIALSVNRPWGHPYTRAFLLFIDSSEDDRQATYQVHILCNGTIKLLEFACLRFIHIADIHNSK